MCDSRQCPPGPIFDGGVINVNEHDIGPVPVRNVRRGYVKLVEPERVPHRRRIEGEGMLTVRELGVPLAKRPVVHLGEKGLGRTDTDAVYEAFPFGIPRRPIACTVDDGDLSESRCAKDPDQ
jgi:hypothetical protein